MWINANGNVYFGDCAQGDREAIPEEVTAWEAIRAKLLIPKSVTPWQIRKALNVTGLRASVEAAVAAADQETKDGWEFATEFRSDDPFVLQMGAALGKSAAETAELIQYAATL